MKFLNSQTIVIAGAGNVGWHLAIALSKAGWNIKNIYSKNIRNAKKLASRVNSIATIDFHEIYSADIIIFCLPDDVLLQKLKTIYIPAGKILLHTSGSLGIDVFNSISVNYGSLYPLQTFKKGNDDLDFSTIPVFVEGSNKKTISILQKLAKSISDSVQQANSQQRLFLHIAAVFACNFSNQMYCLAEEICKKHNIDFQLLVPLILQTAMNTKKILPSLNQTGPAKRKDMAVIGKHLEILSAYPELKDMYSSITNSIFVRNNEDGHA
jgi:predicted short-subunit dehydrogenase-like oxidoreductase (DUF2520 family)